MTTLRKVLPLFLLLPLFAFPQGTQNNVQLGVVDASASAWKFPTRLFANLPAAASSTGQRFTVTDCVTSACTAGSGTLRQDMVSTGSAWIPAVSSAVVTDASNNALVGTTLLTNAEYSNGTCTTAATISAANGNRQKVTLTNAQTCALTFTQPTGSTVSIQLKVIQSAAGSFNGTISGGKWPGGAAPTITATAGAVDVLSCYLDGTNAYCAATQDFR